jgi:hypothetical protein
MPRIRIPRILARHRLASLVLAVAAGVTLIASPAAAATAGAATAGAATPVRVAIQWHQVAAPVARLAAVRPMAASCSGYGCDNKDPNATGCADRWTSTAMVGNVALGGVTFATINLRYSPTCGTNWAQITNNRTGDYAVIRVCRDQGDLRCSDSFTSNGVSAWSNQMYAYNITATAYATLYLDGGQALGWATY